MKKRVVIRKYAFILSVLMILSVFMLSSCGEVKEYKSPHDSGKIIINSYEDLEKLMFTKGTLPEDIAKVIPDFCIYESADLEPIFSSGLFPNEKYRAKARVNFDALCRSCGVEEIGDQIIKFSFNADKDFDGWVINYEDKSQIFSKILSYQYQGGGLAGSELYTPLGELGFLLNSEYGLIWYNKNTKIG